MPSFFCSCMFVSFEGDEPGIHQWLPTALADPLQLAPHRRAPPPECADSFPVKLFPRPFSARLFVRQASLSCNFKELFENGTLLVLPLPETLPSVTCTAPYFTHALAHSSKGLPKSQHPPHPVSLPCSFPSSSPLVLCFRVLSGGPRGCKHL